MSTARSPSLNSDDSIGNLRAAPVDKNHVVWLICCLLGIGILFPWNVFITAIDYFADKYPDVAFEFIVGLAYQWCSIAFFLVSLKYGHNYSVKNKILVGFGIDFLMLIFVPVIGEIGLPTTASLILTLGAAGLTGIASALLFGTVLSFVAMLPSDYTTAVMSGNGVGAVVVAILRIITKGIFTGSDGETESTILYFSIAAAVIFACIISYLAMLKMEFVEYHINQNTALKQTVDFVPEQSVEEKEPLLGSDSSDQRLGSRAKEVDGWEVFRMIRKDCFLVWFVFFVSLSLFPGMTGEIESQYDSLGDWFGIFMITLFQVGDMVGRTLPKWWMGIDKDSLGPFIYARVIFYPLFILCIEPRIFKWDPVPYIVMFIFSLTNGYFSTLAMIYGPSRVDARYRDLAGLYMSFFLQFGILCGVTSALLLLYLVEGESPV